MATIKRREFLKRALVAAASGMAPGCVTGDRGFFVANGEAFPSVEPARVDVDPQKLAIALEFIDAEVQAGSIPGAALVATRRGGKFVEHYCGIYHGIGGDEQPFNRMVANPLFSFSKGISATVAVMAHQDGLIDYDVPVSTYVPEFTGGGKDSITLRHLLTHSAGIPSAGGGPALTEDQWREFLKSVCAVPIEWPVGSRTAYHGVSGMFVVAEAVRRVSAMKPWNAICRERLFDPIGAQTLSFSEPVPTHPAASLPPYFDNLEKFGLAGHPAGGCFGSVDDMLRVLNLIVNGGAWHGKRLLKPDALKDMLSVQYSTQIADAIAKGQQPVHESWGLGWLVRGTSPTCGAAHWFGFGDSTSPTLFGHAGVDTIYGDGDPARQLAYVFAMTGKPRDAEESTRLRREVSNRLQAALDGSDIPGLLS
ncbi:MAG: Beta-lactamase protein [Candidatus Hydrogenedentes bacterium]|nr:Beta-lactamase protein [Candidatus Hydrogenedentota bacterium]